MSTIDDYILGNELLHAQLRVCIGMLGKLVAVAPHSVTQGQIEELTGYSSAGVAKLCRSLCSAGLMRPDLGRAGAWQLACDPDTTTLEAVLRCLLGQQLERSTPFGGEPEQSERSGQELELLVTQMTMAINQSVFHHLR